METIHSALPDDKAVPGARDISSTSPQIQLEFLLDRPISSGAGPPGEIQRMPNESTSTTVTERL